jgi:hypothetical protein
VLDKDVAADAPADARVTAVEPHASYELRLPAAPGAAPTSLSVQTLESNDEGVAFLVRAMGSRSTTRVTSTPGSGAVRPTKTRRPRSSSARSSRALLPGPVDLAFVPLDPRLKDPAAGIAAFMDVVGARALFPMHYWDNAEDRSRPHGRRLGWPPTQALRTSRTSASCQTRPRPASRRASACRACPAPRPQPRALRHSARN